MEDNKFLLVKDSEGKTVHIEVKINICIDYNRSIWREKYHDKQSDKEVHQDTLNDKFSPRELHSASGEEEYFEELEYEKLYEAIEMLPKLEKSRIILHYFHHFEISEIANIEGKTVRAIEISMKKAKEKLRKFLSE